MKVCFIRAKSDGVGHYRVSIPALALRERGHTVDIADGQDLKGVVNIGMFAGYDLIVSQKVKLPEFFHHVRRLPEEQRPKVVFETDDLVTGLHPTNPSFYDYAPHAEGFKECMRLADALTVSTEELAACYSRLNVRCHVVPNYLDIPGLRDWETPESRPDDRLTVGWLGGLHHVGDEQPMVPGLREFLKCHPSVVFAFCGNEQLGAAWKRSIGIPDDQWRFIHGRDFDGYQTAISQFDVAVAPLAQGEFNRCKSDLRLLEYGAWGVPYVASNIAPYRRFHLQSGQIGGYLANEGMEWYTFLSFLVQSYSNRQVRGMDLRKWVLKHRGSEACGVHWETVLGGILADAIPSRVLPPEVITRNTFCPCGSGVKYKRCCSPAWG